MLLALTLMKAWYASLQKDSMVLVKAVCTTNQDKSFTDHVLVITMRKDMLVHYLYTDLLAQDNSSQLSRRHAKHLPADLERKVTDGECIC